MSDEKERDIDGSDDEETASPGSDEDVREDEGEEGDEESGNEPQSHSEPTRDSRPATRDPSEDEEDEEDGPPSRSAVFAWLRRQLGRKPFEDPHSKPTSGSAESINDARVEAGAEEEIDDWEDEWRKPVTTDDPHTKPTVKKAVWFRRDPERLKDWLIGGAITAFVLALYIPFAGTFGLWDPWETHYGEVSRHMTETNDWISPWWGSHWHRPDAGPEGSGFFSKPILVLWSMAIGMEVWGWTEFAIRIGVALMASLAVILTYFSGASVWNRKTGVLMATVMGTSPFFFFLARQTQTDMPFVGMMVCAMALFMMGAFGKDRRKPADAVHYGLFFLTLLICVVPQLYLIAVDEGFSETQRAMRPGLRAQSMNDFKGKDWYENIVAVKSPHLSPKEREELAGLPPAEAQQRVEESKSWMGDFVLELTGPSIVIGLGVLGLLFALLLGLRGRLVARMLHEKDNRITALVLIGLALLSQFLALILQTKRLYDAFGANWESQFGTGFNLVKYSGVALALLFLISTGALLYALLRYWRAEDEEEPEEKTVKRWKWIVFGLTGLVVAGVFVSPIFLVMKSKALGLDGLSFWAVENFGGGRLVRIVLGSVYAPLVLVLFVGVASAIFFTARSKFWKERNPIALWALLVAIGSGIFTCVTVFYIPVAVEGQISTFGKVAGKIIGAAFQWGPSQIVLYSLCIVIVAWSLVTSKRKTVGQLCFLGFYIFAALATMAKGLLGFALPGAICFFYLLFTVEWKRLAEFEVPRGILVFIAVGVPWYASMLILHENAYFQRFFVHDHFKRLASGVHAIDDGTIEHFIHWLGYGLWPWAALVPAAAIRLGMGRSLLLRDDRSRATLMIAIWAIFAFALFSLSSTKFHHYTFPVVPPLALLVALLLSDLFDGQMKRFFPLALGSIVVLVLIGVDLYDDPRHWKNLFTYKYDRAWIDLVPEYTANLFGEPTVVNGAQLNDSFKEFALWIGGFSAIGLVLLGATQTWIRRLGVAVLTGAAVVLTMWGLNYYMPGISPTWSQKGLWMSYWNDCTQTEAPLNADEKKIWCEESSLVYRITWRGEHYYSQNEAIPIGSDDDLAYFAEYNGDTPFYIMTDRTRYCLGSDKSPNFGDECKRSGSIVGEMRKHFGSKELDHELVWDQNLKFVMVKFYPAGNPDAKKASKDTRNRGTPQRGVQNKGVQSKGAQNKTTPPRSPSATTNKNRPTGTPTPAGRIGAPARGTTETGAQRPSVGSKPVRTPARSPKNLSPERKAVQPNAGRPSGNRGGQEPENAPVKEPDKPAPEEGSGQSEPPAGNE